MKGPADKTQSADSKSHLQVRSPPPPGRVSISNIRSGVNQQDESEMRGSELRDMNYQSLNIKKGQEKIWRSEENIDERVRNCHTKGTTSPS